MSGTCLYCHVFRLVNSHYVVCWVHFYYVVWLFCNMACFAMQWNFFCKFFRCTCVFVLLWMLLLCMLYVSVYAHLLALLSESHCSLELSCVKCTPKQSILQLHIQSLWDWINKNNVSNAIYQSGCSLLFKAVYSFSLLFWAHSVAFVQVPCSTL